MAELPVLIAGAGIGGLTLACALAKHGVPCRVFEKAKEFRPIGAGITMQSNAMLAFRAIGLEAAVLAAGEIATTAVIRKSDGGVLSTVDLAAIAHAVGAPTIAVHRGDLHGVLRAAAGDVVMLGAEATGYRVDDDAVTVLLAGGREARGSVLIGADGLHSAIRTQVLGETPLRYPGYTSWRGVTRPDMVATLPPGMPSATELLGKGERFGVVSVGRGRIYWFALANTPEGERDDDPRAIVRARFGGWSVPVAALIDATPDGDILRTDIHDRAPVAKWGDGRVTLLGDAAHPMTPNLAQGGGQAVEDAVVLATCLAAGATPAALRAYETARITRANKVVVDSRRLGALFQVSGAVSTRLRNAVLRGSSGAATRSTIKLMRGFVLDPAGAA